MIHLQLTAENIAKDEGNIFIFPYGAVVIWGLSEEKELEFCKKIRPFLAALSSSLCDLE